jgi:hypothetical protein
MNNECDHMPPKYKLQIIPLGPVKTLTAWIESTDNLPLFKRTYDAFKPLGGIGFASCIYRNDKTISEQELEEDCSSN